MKKRYCGECKYLKFEDADVNTADEACVEFEESETKDMDYE